VRGGKIRKKRRDRESGSRSLAPRHQRGTSLSLVCLFAPSRARHIGKRSRTKQRYQHRGESARESVPEEVDVSLFQNIVRLRLLCRISVSLSSLLAFERGIDLKR